MEEKIEKRFADKIGAEYALFPLAEPHYADFQKKVGEITAAHSDTATILEVGCGTGLTTKELAAVLPSASIVALDVEQVMLDQAVKNVLSDKVSFVCADALDYLKLQKDKSFDAVVTAFALHNTPADYREKVFTEIGRALTDDGVIVVCDKIAQDDVLEYWQSFKKQVDAFEVFKDTDYPELQKEWTEHYLVDDRVRLTEKEQRNLFKVAGCSNIVLHDRILLDAIFSGTKK